MTDVGWEILLVNDPLPLKLEHPLQAGKTIIAA
jgi:hypothetical protein